VAIAGTLFGGDDTGTIPDPSHKTTLKCEDGIGKAVGCIGKCTLSREDIGGGRTAHPHHSSAFLRPGYSPAPASSPLARERGLAG